ncbi:hypothetical protein [Neolewinella agarilytica]|uniref:Uncharacterized protein n=1 Tax=Neolewinella agarilytica TaxID=478744 RepID=A0A1H9L8S1_9BACT|nr:hypothetical protein [Neolewinella agarilytica]SER07575.1 hypothetical protein SAMN05444359_12347 [Neolewinella agarilytica]
MKEKNKKTLRDALEQLPEYGADAGAWKAIEAGLTPALSERLPSYQPPAEVWNGLNKALNSPAPVVSIRRRKWARIGGIAASVLVIVALGVGLWPEAINAGPRISISYAQEVAPATSSHDWNADEESFNHVIAQIEERNEPTLNTLNMELAELTAAKEEMKAMLVAYGEDPSVIRQLAEIERDRSDIYRRIIVEL